MAPEPERERSNESPRTPRAMDQTSASPQLTLKPSSTITEMPEGLNRESTAVWQA